MFNANGVDYKALDTEPTITQKYGNVQGVKIYPTFSSRGYLVMAISLTSYDSGKKREKIYYVNYNRRGQSVLSFNSIFASNSEDALLTLVNNKIESRPHAFLPTCMHANAVSSSCIRLVK